MYRIKGIYHSGRKGPRMEPVTEEKYEGVNGSIIGWDVESIRQFRSTRFWFEDHPLYSWWDTSAILQLRKRDFNIYELETVNTIYILEDLEE